jgi:hypothetical protein
MAIEKERTGGSSFKLTRISCVSQRQSQLNTPKPAYTDYRIPIGAMWPSALLDPDFPRLHIAV